VGCRLRAAEICCTGVIQQEYVEIRLANLYVLSFTEDVLENPPAAKADNTFARIRHD